jgi:hypothetical protein
MHLRNYLQHFINLLFSELEVLSLLYVDLRIFCIYHPNLFPNILNYSEILRLMPKMNIIKNTVSVPDRK